MHKPRYFICGGGCFGSFYVRQLLRARDAGKLDFQQLIVLDRDPHCQAAPLATANTDVRLSTTPWEDFGDNLRAQRDAWADDWWVPAPIAPHLFRIWAERWLRHEGLPAAPAPWPDPPPDLPFAEVLESGALALSHAPGVCPANCIEPRKCPLTGGDRSWEMRHTITTLVPPGTPIAVAVCQHHAHGVGTIAMRQILDGLDAVIAGAHAGQTSAVIATVSSCHGLIDRLNLTPP